MSKTAALATMAGTVALSSPAQAQSIAPVQVSVDATISAAPIERVWPFYGYDEINYTTLPEGKALLGTLGALNSAPVHVRSHFLFNTGDGTPALKWGSTNVYAEDAAGNPIYDWTLTDSILDSITGSGTFPLVELGFMPQALSTHPDPYRNSGTTVLDGGCFYPPRDYAKWAALIRAWAAHADQRYPNVATSWLWELWNEPDIGYWHGTVEEYSTLYDHTESALHEVLPNAVLGGPAVANPERSFLRQFLEHCATGTNAVTGATGTRLDLVSFHAKGGVGVSGDHIQMDLGTQLRLHRSGFVTVAAFPQFAHTPIYITEADPDGCAACPASIVPADAYRNSTAYGAYELSMMKRTLELETAIGIKLGGVLTWAFTFPGTPYFAGYRALATNGIHLPVLSAFSLLGGMKGARLPLVSDGAHLLEDVLANGVRGEPDIDGMATRDGDTLQILLWNYHDDIVTVPASPVHLTLRLPAAFGSSVRVSHRRVDESHGDAYSVWLAQGMPADPSPAQLEALRQAMSPSLLLPDEVVPVTMDGSLELDLTLPRFGVSLITLEPTDGSIRPNPNAAASAGGCSCRATRASAVSVPATLLAIGLAWLWRRRRPHAERRHARLPARWFRF